jgi:hypothetical protein
MVGTQMRMHPDPRLGLRLQIPDALQRVSDERRLLVAYPVSPPVPVPQPAPTQKPDFAGNGLSFWQTNPMAFAARQPLEEP